MHSLQTKRPQGRMAGGRILALRHHGEAENRSDAAIDQSERFAFHGLLHTSLRLSRTTVLPFALLTTVKAEREVLSLMLA